MVRISLVLLMLLGSQLLFSFPTQSHYYRQSSNTDSQTKLHITHHKAGACLGQSIRIVREDAWRCVADGVTYDPCFEHPGGPYNQLICVDSPWSQEALMLDIPMLTETDRRHQKTLDMSATLPWAVVLNHSDRCLATDHQQQIKEYPIAYACESGAVLYGYLQRCHKEWTIIKQHPGQPAELTSIQEAWF